MKFGEEARSSGATSAAPWRRASTPRRPTATPSRRCPQRCRRRRAAAVPVVERTCGSSDEACYLDAVAALGARRVSDLVTIDDDDLDARA